MLEVSRSTYAKYERGKTDPPAGHLLKLATYYKVTTDDLLTKDLGIPLFRQPSEKEDSILSDDIRVLPITVSEGPFPNIDLVPAKAVAGYVVGMKDAKYIAELPRFYLPRLPEGSYRAFEIQGDSMPPIQDGYIVIGRYVEQARNLKNGSRYIVVLRDEGVVFKKVINEVDENNQLILASDNFSFMPYSVNAKDVMEMWEFVAFVGFPDKMDLNYILLDKLHDLQQQIALLIANKS